MEYQFNQDEFETISEITGLVSSPPRIRIYDTFIIVNWRNLGISYSWKNTLPYWVEIRNLSNEKTQTISVSDLNEALV